MARAPLLLLLVPAAVASNAGFVPKCTSLLSGVAASGHSDVEVAAFCRQAYTPKMCSSMRSSLGQMPWPTAKIENSCQQWGSDLAAGSDRDMLSYEEFNQALESSANMKKQLGYNIPRKADGSLDLDKAVESKYQQTQVMVQAYSSYYGEGEATPPPQKHNFFGEWSAGRVAFKAGDFSKVAGGCGLVGFFMLIVGASVGFVRWMRPPRATAQREDALLEESIE